MKSFLNYHIILRICNQLLFEKQLLKVPMGWSQLIHHILKYAADAGRVKKL